MCILPGLLHFTSRYGFPKLNAVVLIEMPILTSRTGKRNQGALIRFVRLLIKISSVAVTAAQFCIWTRYYYILEHKEINIVVNIDV